MHHHPTTPRQSLGPRHLCALLISCLLAGPALADEDHPPRPDLEPGHDTTGIDGPFLPDGTPNYVAAVNQIAAADIAPEDNAFIPIAQLLAPRPDDQDIDPETRNHWQLTFQNLGIDPPDQDTPRFIPLNDFAAQQGQPLEQSAAHSRIDALRGQPWTRDDDPLVADWLDANDQALDILADALERPDYYAPIVHDHEQPFLWAALLPHLRNVRDFSRTLTVRSQYHLGNDDPENAWRDIETTYRLAYHVSSEPFNISHLVAISVKAIAVNTIENALAHHQIEPDQARQLIARLDRVPTRANLADSLARFERYNALDLFFQFLDDRDDLDQWHAREFGLNSSVPQMIREYAEQPDFDLNEALREINRWYDDIEDAFDIPDRAERAQALSDIDQRIEQLWPGTQPEPPDDRSASQAAADYMIAFYMLALRSTLNADLRIRAHEATVPPAIALTAYRNQHGDYPQSLDALVPEYFDAVPTDPMDRQPLRYRAEDDFVKIYSIGPNFTDNGGRDFRNADDSFEADITFRLSR